jgi:hypothetical protein
MKKPGIWVVMALTIIAVLSTVENLKAQRFKSEEIAQSTEVRNRNYHKIVSRKAHARYTDLPRWGEVVSSLPSTTHAIKVYNRTYYCNDGIYYTKTGANYTVVNPPLGTRVAYLPSAKKLVVGPRYYYYYYGSFYLKATDANEYEIVNPPQGGIVDALPEGYEVKKVKNAEYYFLDGVYYAEVDAHEFKDRVGYEVVDPAHVTMSFRNGEKHSANIRDNN